MFGFFLLKTLYLFNFSFIFNVLFHQIKFFQSTHGKSVCMAYKLIFILCGRIVDMYKIPNTWYFPNPGAVFLKKRKFKTKNEVCRACKPLLKATGYTQSNQHLIKNNLTHTLPNNVYLSIRFPPVYVKLMRACSLLAQQMTVSTYNASFNFLYSTLNN